MVTEEKMKLLEATYSKKKGETGRIGNNMG